MLKIVQKLFTVIFLSILISCVSKPPLTLKEDKEVKMFLDNYLSQYAQLEKDYNLAMWEASVSGKKEDFDKVSQAEFKLKEFHSQKEMLKQIEDFLEHKKDLNPYQKRSLEIAYLRFKENQIDKVLLKKIVDLSNEIMMVFNTYRAKYKGKSYTNNELLEMLAKETNSENRKQIWSALKQVGQKVAPKLIKLAHLRNEAAKSLGYDNFWQMSVILQEYSVEDLLALFDELDKLTLKPFEEIKYQIDDELAKKFKIPADKLMPWHYDNPFFQEPPSSTKFDLDTFFAKFKKEDIPAIAQKFFSDVGLDVSDVIERSDLYDKPGKDQHAFCTSIDRGADVRILTNIKPNLQWMETTLHELGHAVYSKYINPQLLYNLRDHAHIFTTEAIAMFFEKFAKNTYWLIRYVNFDPKVAKDYARLLAEQIKRKQLVFARWTLVMLYFEKSFYENPNQNLNKLWWNLVAKYQKLKIPKNRTTKADWASKPHFTVAPVYYHNYMLGELFAAQLRYALKSLNLYDDKTLPNANLGSFLKHKVFSPGASKKWDVFVKDVTGYPLSSKFFVDEVTKM